MSAPCSGGVGNVIAVASISSVDINQASETEFSAWGTSPELEVDLGNVFTAQSNGVDCAAGAYLVSLNIYAESTAARNNAFIRISVDGAAVGSIRAAGGYIRATSGHNEASLHLVEVPVVLQTPGRISFVYQQASTPTGAMTVGAGQASMTIKSVSYGRYGTGVGGA